MNSSSDSNAFLNELNQNELKELVPLFVILGLVLLFGLLGNVPLILFVWSGARRNVGTFFLLVLAIVDTLVCLTVPLVVVEYSEIYIFTNDAICKFSAFCRLSLSLFSVSVLITIAVHRYRKICRPFKQQFDMYSARTTTVCGLLWALFLSFPKLFLVETAKMEIANDNNLTVFGSDCVVKALNNEDLKGFQTFLEATHGVLFVGSFAVLLILYFLQGRAILELNRTHAKLTRTTQLACISNSAFEPLDDQLKPIEQNMEDGEHFLMTTTPDRQTAQILQEQTRKATQRVRERKLSHQKSKDSISPTKVSIMFFSIALGFILSFLPYIVYSLWRGFAASTSEIVFTVSPLNLFCLNSYLINTVVNPIVYGFFNSKFRQYLKSCIPCLGTT